MGERENPFNVSFFSFSIPLPVDVSAHTYTQHRTSTASNYIIECTPRRRAKRSRRVEERRENSSVANIKLVTVSYAI